MPQPEAGSLPDRAISRRTAIVGGAAATFGMATAPQVARADTRSTDPSRLAYPFTLGVASGDPKPDGVVLWTRLAPSPVDDDGMGGMSAKRSYPVQWQVATDERMRHVVRRGTVQTRPQSAHSVHVEVDGLEQGAEYFYRFRCHRHLSPVGRTLTAPTGRSHAKFAVASCQAMIDGYFTAYSHMVQDAPDVVFFLGDYIYEHHSNGGTGRVRDHLGPRPHTLANYRQAYACYKTDEELQAAHLVAPWVVTLDDHEIEDNWAGEDQMDVLDVPGYDFVTQRTNGLRAYYEHMPMRRPQRPVDGHMRIHRRLEWGSLASLHVLDTRQYRSGITHDLEEALDPRRTMTGQAQERWLLNGMARSDAVWNIVLNQTMFVARTDTLGPDSWNGYRANRDRIINGLVDRSVQNVLVFTGNQHQNYFSNILADFDDPSSRIVGTEFAGTSITSGRDGRDRPGRDRVLEKNPWIKFHNQQRGYLLSEIDRAGARVDARVLPYVTRPGAPVETRASFTVEAGRPGLPNV